MATRKPRRGRGPKGRLGLSLLLSLAAGLMLAPAPAQATADLGSAIRIADAALPSVPRRCGSVKIEIGPLSPDNVLASAESFFGLCKVRYAPKTFEFATNAQLCSLTVHEWGHLAGLPHSPDPNSFMHPTIPHNPVCGESDQQASARLALATERRRKAINRQLSKLRRSLRATRRARRGAGGAERARLARRAKRLRSRIRRLEGEIHSLPVPVLYVLREAPQR